MQLFVRSNATRVVEVSEGASVEELKALVGADGLRMVFAGRHLEDGHALSEYGVQKESTVELLGSLSGGAKKRKKKTYTKPKKNKHKRRKVKLAFLQFYKVDDSGKVTRLRKECPSTECGAGVFMANHFDRHYCGRCGLTYVYEADDKAAKGGKGGKGGKAK